MHRKSRCSLLAAFALLPLAALAADPEKAVVQIFTFSQEADWDEPWKFGPLRRSSGTGFIIKGRRIMTNAHVVSWARQLLVKRYQDPRPYLARVVFVGHDCDLALLEVEDSQFYNGVEPLEFGTLPKVRSTVVTYGYPAGGEQISYTRGVVSRIELQTYAHIGNRSLLGVQTDAAINPGNSGGPVIQDDKVIGVAFQGMPGLENAGFFIPPPVINHFLEDIQDGKYDGFPSAGVRTAPLQNAAYRRKLKLPENDLGVRVDSVLPGTPAEKILRADDVILQVGKHEVGSDGTIIYEGNRMALAMAVQEMQHGQSLPMKIWRDGKEQSLAVPVEVSATDKVLGNQYDLPPRYFVYAGLVFTPLSLDYLKTFGRSWSDTAGAELTYELFYRRHEAPQTLRSEPIVLSMVLADEVNANFRVKGRALVDKINGVRIERMEDVIRAFESPSNGQHVVEFMPKNTIECLERAEADKANANILKTYGIQKDRRL
ncbi:MAG: PDZ domain-containing protein [Limisphaerales bacterium]